MRGYSAVRIAKRPETMTLKEGPTPVAGRAQTWYLDLEKPEDQRELLVYAEEVRPRDLWTSQPLRGG